MKKQGWKHNNNITILHSLKISLTKENTAIEAKKIAHLKPNISAEDSTPS